jgi:hypothetical protein
MGATGLSGSYERVEEELADRDPSEIPILAPHKGKLFAPNPDNELC